MDIPAPNNLNAKSLITTMAQPHPKLFGGAPRPFLGQGTGKRTSRGHSPPVLLIFVVMNKVVAVIDQFPEVFIKIPGNNLEAIRIMKKPDNLTADTARCRVEVNI